MSFYELLSKRYGIEIVGGVQTIEPTVTNEEESEALGVPLHAPAFQFERTTRAEGGVIVEFVRSIYRGDRYRLVTEFSRRDRPNGGPVLVPRDGSLVPERGALCPRRTPSPCRASAVPATSSGARSASSLQRLRLLEHEPLYADVAQTMRAAADDRPHDRARVVRQRGVLRRVRVRLA